MATRFAALPRRRCLHGAVPCAPDDLKLEAMRKLLQTRLTRHSRRAVLSSRMDGLRLCRAHVGGSTIEGGGNGLFASREIAAGELITFYPGDVIESGERAELSEYEVRFEFDGVESVRVIGDASLTGDAAYLGHMSNDCGRCLTPTAMAMRDYALTAAAHANTDHHAIEDSHIATVASRQIAMGEELFVSYGPGYWLTRQGYSVAEVHAAEVDLGLEIRRGGELAKTILRALQERGAQSFPPWILECFEKSKAHAPKPQA